MTTRQRAKRKRKRRLLTIILHKQEIIKLLKKEGYNITRVCGKLGLAKDTVYTWLANDFTFREQVEAIKNSQGGKYRGRGFYNPALLRAIKKKKNNEK